MLRLLLLRGRHGQRLQRVEQAARVAVGIGDQPVARLVVHGRHGVDLQRALHDLLQVLFGQRLQHVDRRARQQGGVDLEGGVLGGGADEGEQAALHVRQKGVLLALVEAVHLVHEDDGALALAQRHLRPLHRLADVLHAAQHGADADELRAKGIGHEPRDRGLARARRAPEDAAVRLARLEGDAQRHAFAQQLLLADDFAQGFGAQSFGQGLVGLCLLLRHAGDSRASVSSLCPVRGRALFCRDVRPAAQSPFFASPKKGNRKKGEPDSSTLRCAAGTLRCSGPAGGSETRLRAQTSSPLFPPLPALLASSLRRGNRIPKATRARHGAPLIPVSCAGIAPDGPPSYYALPN